MPKDASYRFAAFAALNVGFALVACIAAVAGGYGDPRLIYLILLFALCSSVLIDLDGFNGRYALLALFMFVYFVSFGVGDLSNLIFGNDLARLAGPTPGEWMTKTECVILLSGLSLVLGYRAAVALLGMRTMARAPRDWSRISIISVGLVMWVIGTIATYRWYVYIVKDTTNEAFRRGLANLDTVTTTLYVLGQMCQPLGMLLLVYAFAVFRGIYNTAVVIAVIGLQVLIGFVVDVKGMAMLGLIVMIVTSVLVRGRLPVVWLVVGVSFVTLIYPYFTAYRTAVHGAGIARSAVVADFGSALEKTAAAKDKVNSGRERAQTFLERSNVKGSVQTAVERTGVDAEFQSGYTLSPILTAFIPKLVWADKVRIPTGQLFNKAFHLDDSPDIYISPSHLGELYWNFGWAGALIGMGLIGLLCGWIGTSFNLREYVTVTRILVTVITVKQIIVGFEGGIADIYVVWIRSLAVIGLLHVIFARTPALSQWAARIPAKALSSSPPERLFPNLMT